MKTIQFEFQLTLKVKMKTYLPSPQTKSWNIDPCARTCIPFLFPIWSGIRSSSSYKQPLGLVSQYKIKILPSK